MNQYGGETPPGLADERTQRETTLLLTGSSTYDSAVRRDPCSNGSCPNYDPSDMEAIWIELVSPVAVPHQTIDLEPAPGTTQPDPVRFDQIRKALRPEGIDDHAVQLIRSTWTSVAEDHLVPMPAGLMSALAELSQFWEGDDFDRFAESVEQVRDNLYDTIDEIGTATNELEVFEDRVYALQGGGNEIPFPAARVWKASSGVVQGPKIHVRPVWASGGDCDKDRDEGDNWEALGLPRDSGNELRSLVDERAAYYVERGMDPATARENAETDYAAAQMPWVSHWSEVMRLASDTHNLRIAGLRDQTVDAQETPALDAGPRPLPESAADAILEPLPELDPGPLPQMPPLDGLDRFTPPAQQAVPEFPSPRADWSAADYGSTGGYDGGSAADWDRSAMDSSSWNRPASDDVSGGLASGGLGSAPGGGLASGGLGGASGGSGGFGSPSGAGSQAGSMGGAFGTPGAVGGGRGAAGAGRGATARPANARPGSARPGGAGAPGARGAGADEGEQDRDTWLTEDEDVWGIVAEDDDPYA